MLTDLVLIAVGIVVGAMNAIAGGGILIGFPVLMAAGLPALTANATSNLITLPGQLASAYGYKAYLKKVPKKYLILLLISAAGAAIGALTLRRTPAAHFEQLVPWLILFAVVLFAFQPLMHFHFHRHLGRAANSSAGWPPAWIMLALVPLAIYGGYFGAGFGFVMLAFLGLTSLHDIHKMNALKNLAAATIAGVSLICLYGAGLINWRAGLAMGLGTTIGGYSGARLAEHVSSHALRIGVIVVGLATAAYIALRPY